MSENSFPPSVRPTLRYIWAKFRLHSPLCALHLAQIPTRGACGVPQTVTHICQKAIFRHALGMFSEALRILDQNTVKYMIEELQKQLEDEKAAAIRERAAVIKEKDAEREAAIKEKDAEKEAVIKEKAAVIMEKDAEIAELKKQLEAVRPG